MPVDNMKTQYKLLIHGFNCLQLEQLCGEIHLRETFLKVDWLCHSV